MASMHDVAGQVGRAEWDALMAVRHLREEILAVPKEHRPEAVDDRTLNEIMAEFFGILGDLKAIGNAKARAA